MNDTLQTYYDKNNSRLPVDPIPNEVKECKSFDFNTMRIEKWKSKTQSYHSTDTI